MHTDDVPGTFHPKRAGLGGEQYGWLIPIEPDRPWSHRVSQDLVAICTLAESVGATWATLNRDEPKMAALPICKWSFARSSPQRPSLGE